MLKKFAGHPAAALMLSFAALSFCNPASALTMSEHLGQGWPFGGSVIAESTPRALELSVADAIDTSSVTEIIEREAMSMLGAEYELGSADNDAVDCSSLMQRIFRAAGFEMPRTAREQSHIGEPVTADELKKGDLVFYRWQRSRLHVAVYMDDGYILHASPSAGRVVLTRITPSWEQRLVAARRLI